MISYAKQKRIVVSAVTNAQCIDRPTASRIVDSNLDRITISLDGVTQESYEKYRVGGKFYKAVEAIRSIVEEKSKKNTPFPFITVQFLVMRHNEDEMEEIKNLAAELRVDGLVFKKVCDMNEPLPDFGNIDKHMPRNAKYRAYKVENKSVRWNTGRKDIDFCGMAWNYPVITWDGELYPCCVAYDALSMGNVFEGGFKKAWNSERFVSFRKKLTEDKHSIYPCRDCGMNFYDDIIEKIAMTDKSYEP